MENFYIIIDGKKIRCTKAYVELDDSIERSAVDYTKLKRLTESCNIPTQISATMSINKGDPNYKRMCELFESLRNKS